MIKKIWEKSKTHNRKSHTVVLTQRKLRLNFSLFPGRIFILYISIFSMYLLCSTILHSAFPLSIMTYVYFPCNNDNFNVKVLGISKYYIK